MQQNCVPNPETRTSMECTTQPWEGKGETGFQLLLICMYEKKPNVCSSNFMMRIIFAICIVINIGPYCTADGGPKSKR